MIATLALGLVALFDWQEGSSPNISDDSLAGVWELVLPPDITEERPEDQRLRLVFAGDWHATFRGSQRVSAFRLKVEPQQAPKRISLVGDHSMRGIYEVKDDGLRLSLAPETEALPTKFGTEHPEFKRLRGKVAQELLDALNRHAQAAESQESMTTRGLRQSGLLPAILPGVSNTQFSIDALAQATLKSQVPNAPSQNQPEPAAEKTNPLFRICRSAQPIPDDLNAHYAKTVRAFRQGDADQIRALSLPGSVVMFGTGFPYNGYGSKERVSLSLGDVNLQWTKDTGLFGFSADVLSVTKHSEDAFLLRTATSGLSFTKTAKSGWRLYAYFDRPFKHDKPAAKEKDPRHAAALEFLGKTARTDRFEYDSKYAAALEFVSKTPRKDELKRWKDSPFAAELMRLWSETSRQDGFKYDKPMSQVAKDAAPGIGEVQKEPQDKTDHAQIQGTWALVEAHKQGKKVAFQDVPITPHTLTVAGQKVMLKNAQPGFTKGTIILDSAAKPKELTIDWLIPWYAVYELNGDLLRICHNPANSIRPTELATAPDSDRVILVYKRKAEQERDKPSDSGEKQVEVIGPDAKAEIKIFPPQERQGVPTRQDT